MSDHRVRLLRWAPIAACAAVLVWHSLRYDFVTDDAYITFVYARNLAHHGELTFNLGHPIEGYTNFLWTVILAAGMVLGIAPELSSRVLGTGFGIGTLVLAFRLTERVLGRRDGAIANPWAYLPPALLALSSGFACWSSGGLETQLFTFLVTLSLDRYVAADRSPRQWRGVGIALALAAMTRPEGLLVAGLVGIHHVALRLIQRRKVAGPDELFGAAAFLAVWLPWFAWRWWYYQWPFPNTYYVKASGHTTAAYDQAMRENGLHYVWAWLRETGLLWVSPLVVASAVVWTPGTARFRLVSLVWPMSLVYVAYTISVGGDFMGLHRFIMPLFVIAAIALTLGLSHGGRIGAGVAVLICILFTWSQLRLDDRSLYPKTSEERSSHGIDSPAYLMAYTDNRAAIGRAMAGCFHDDDFSIVGGAGAQPYFADMRSVDLFGLVSGLIAHGVAPSFARAGHDKRAPDNLLFGYFPDFVFSCYAIHASPTFGPLSCGGFWRKAGFVQVTMQIPGLDGRKEGRDDAPVAGQPADRYTFLVKKDRGPPCGNGS